MSSLTIWLRLNVLNYDFCQRILCCRWSCFKVNWMYKTGRNNMGMSYRKRAITESLIIEHVWPSQSMEINNSFYSSQCMSHDVPRSCKVFPQPKLSAIIIKIRPVYNTLEFLYCEPLKFDGNGSMCNLWLISNLCCIFTLVNTIGTANQWMLAL